MDTSTNLQWICGTLILISVVAGLFVLAWHGTITGAQLLGVVGVIIGIAGGAFGVHAGVNAGIKAHRLPAK